MNSEPSPVQVTRMLKEWTGGDESALERLTPIVYSELHRLARNKMLGEREGHMLQPSALVNEAFVRLLSGEPIEWTSRAHFFAHSARLMRQILVDFARAQDAGKRGARSAHLDLSEIQDVAGTCLPPVDFLDLDVALEELAELDPRQAQVVGLRYFGGLENAEVAEVLGVGEATIVRDWRVARAWLFSRLQPSGNPS